MNNSPGIVYVTTDQRGHDIHGNGSHQRPFRTIARARSDYPDALICLDDVHTNMESRQLTELGEEVGEVDFAPANRAMLVFGACTVAFVVGSIVGSALAAFAIGLLLVAGVLGIEKIAAQGMTQ
jgi:hypothetical protein